MYQPVPEAAGQMRLLSLPQRHYRFADLTRLHYRPAAGIALHGLYGGSLPPGFVL
jgi:hypothetical protein